MIDQNFPCICVVYDVDGVLIDVRQSFYAAIKKTVVLYIQKMWGCTVPDHFVTDEDIKAFKSLGGFNDDWDLTAAILYYLASLHEMGPVNKHADVAVLLSKDITAFTSSLKAQGLPAVAKATQGRNAGWVLFKDGSAESLSVEAQGGIPASNLVKRIFQEIYWGQALFEQHYPMKAEYYCGMGTIDQEEQIMPVRYLQQLADSCLGLAIATGRERHDALYSLKKFSYDTYFQKIVTLSDVGEAYKKPHPESLYKIDRFWKEQKKMPKHYIYIGDQIDDMRMGRLAQEALSVTPVGYLRRDETDKEQAMRALGVNYIMYDHSSIFEVLQRVKN